MAETGRIFPSDPAVREAVARNESQRARRTAAQATAKAPQADLLTRIRKAAPHMPATVVVALAQAGMEPDHPEFQKISKAAAKYKGKSGWASIGDMVKVGTLPLQAAAKVAGKGLGLAGKGADIALGGIDEAVTPALKGAARTGFLAAQSGYEEAQGAVRNVAAFKPGGIPIGAAVAGGATAAALIASAPVSLGAGAAAGVIAGGAALGAAGGTKVEGQGRWEPQSSGAVALGRRLAGQQVDLGSGWLPNTHAGEDQADPDATWTIAEEQRRRAQRVRTEGGHALTPGRLLTVGVLDEESTAAKALSGLVDGSLALSRFDPTAAGLKTFGNVNRNRKLFTEGYVKAGGLLSSRPQISAKEADAWWTGATDLREALVSHTGDEGFYEIWKATKGKLGAKTTWELAQATDDAAVDAIIRPKLGVDNALRGPLQASFDTHIPFRNVRLTKMMPGTHVDVYDPDQSVRTVERWLQNAKASPELIARETARMAAASGRPGRFAALESTMEATKGLLVEKGWDRASATRMTRLYGDAAEDTRGYFINALEENVEVPGMWLTGESKLPRPHAYVEYINRAVPLPDARDIRAATSAWALVLKNKAIWGTRDKGTAAVDFIQGKVWKRMALLRGAYTVRVVGEEQVRMAASGLDSLVSHPLSLIAMRLSEDSVMGRAAAKVGLDVGRADADVLGGEFRYRDAGEFEAGMDEFNQALNRQWAGWAEPGRLPAWTKYQPQHQRFVPVWGEELGKLASDPIHREAARALLDGRSLDEVKDWFSSSNYRMLMSEDSAGLATRSIADKYIDSVAERIRYTTTNDPQLVEMIATGKLGDAPMRKGLRTSPELKSYLEAAERRPEYLYGQMSLGEQGSKAAWMDQATTWMFSNLMGERTNNLSRSPSFRQFYWQRAEELAPFMDETSKARLVAQARAMKLDDVAERVAGMKATGELTLEQADVVAKGFGLDETRKLLMDMTERSQFFDAYRLVFPFGEAWKEMTKTWGKIAVERPQTFRRGQQVIQGAREDGADSMFGDEEGRGFFYKNANGQEVFAFPGSEILSQELTGVPVPLTGRTAGLSLMTEVMPGVGPVVQIAAGAFLPDIPDWDFARNILYPFGEPETEQGLLESFLPAWMQKFRQAGLGGKVIAQDEQQFNSAVMDVARYLASTGEYDTADRDDAARMFTDAIDKAKTIYVMRGAAQFFAPTAPTPEWIARDKDGNALVAQVVIGEYHDLLQEDPDGALDEMFDRYGDGIFLLLQGKTVEVTPGAPVSKEGADWERANAGVVKAYPNVFGFFAPEGGDLDLAAFGRQVEAGRRVQPTPRQALDLAHARVANVRYQQAKREVGPTPTKEQRAWLRDYKAALIEAYPGYTENVGLPDGPTSEQLVRDLTRAAKDKRLDGNPVVSPLRSYLEARDAAMAAAREAGMSPDAFKGAKAMAPIRAWLRELGETLVEVEPGFAPMWDRVFDAELKDVAEEAEEDEAPR